ncbi:MAG: coenzyme A pyrophosphatase, partial [Sphingopyxis sp.]
FDPDNYARQHANFQGHDRHYYDMDWQGRRIWGVTAGIIINLARRMPAGWHR